MLIYDNEQYSNYQTNKFFLQISYNHDCVWVIFSKLHRKVDKMHFYKLIYDGDYYGGHYEETYTGDFCNQLEPNCTFIRFSLIEVLYE